MQDSEFSMQRRQSPQCRFYDNNTKKFSKDDNSYDENIRLPYSIRKMTTQRVKLSLKSESRSPKKRIESHHELYTKSKLTMSIKSKEVFVMKDGAKVISGTKLLGFNYPVHINFSFIRNHHAEEMKDFFAYCTEFFKSPIEFRFLFSTTGKLLRCLHEISSTSKIVLVSPLSKFQGIQENQPTDDIRLQTRSPCYRSLLLANTPTNKSPGVLDNLNCQFAFSTRKCNNVEEIVLPSIKINPGRLRKTIINPKLNSFEKLKLKLGDVSAKIDKTFPPLHEQGLKQLKENFRFTEGELHKHYAKFKLLVLLSCGINPKHSISSGISRKTFIEFFGSSKELNFVLGRIFDKFDSDGGGSVSWEEYLTAMKIMRYGTYNEQIELFFDAYDKDGSGTLSFDEIQELCKVQLQADNDDKLIDDLSYSFASLIFDITKTGYDGEISCDQIKTIVKEQNDNSLIDMFCSFNFLK
ncbi:hypothetical protein SteCoe_10936 [Stentor coeruleus]|uniref:EF-hand domain-containing protein n=1 Tax=Stentor coeruleus TaxID=5963 RepID=A0A1R2CEA6_9CILI|nr:hypothetical protein SteCoe_10936 [Stentor coeruleus]